MGLIAYNAGSSAADDVIIQDSLPSLVSLPPGVNKAVLPVVLDTNLSAVITSASSQQKKNSAVAIGLGTNSSITASKANYFVTLDPGNLLTIHGLHLDPNAVVTATYFMSVPVNTPVGEQLVAGTSFIAAGNGNQTPYMVNSNIPFWYRRRQGNSDEFAVKHCYEYATCHARKTVPGRDTATGERQSDRNRSATGQAIQQ